ncbi:MAG: ABC transporter permease [Clostridiales bacterium]|jgi:spermidine/putrescine transport system permease protein|nr:ABC transporter permease [Clostridiales bacterium]
MAWLKRNIAGLPAFLWMAVLVGIPLIYIIVLSFLTRNPDGTVGFVFTLANYDRITDPVTVSIFMDSFGAALLTSACALLIGYPFAYFVSRLDKKLRFYVLVFLMIAFWTSSLIRTYGWIIILQTNGVLSGLFERLGFIKEPARFMYSYPSVIAVTTYMFLPFMILPVYNAVEKIDPTLYEASYDLGAGKVKTFAKITLPLSSSGIAGGVTLVFVPSVGLYFISDLIGGARTMLLGSLIKNQMDSARNWPFGAALSVVMLGLVGLFVVFYLSLAKDNGEGLF